jgi:hypothetical protein
MTTRPYKIPPTAQERPRGKIAQNSAEIQRKLRRGRNWQTRALLSAKCPTKIQCGNKIRKKSRP